MAKAELDRRMKHCNALVSKFAGFRSNDRFCDVEVKVDGKVFKCHRLVLSAASEYFDTMFNGKFKESSAKEIALHEIESNVFEQILEFIYTGNAVVHKSNAYNLIRAAEFYRLPSMVELCVEFVKENLNAVAEDVLKFFSFGHLTNNEQLVELLKSYICKNFGYYSKTSEFTKLTFYSLIEILKLVKKLKTVVHDPFLEGIYIWIGHQVNLTSQVRKRYSKSLIQLIDFRKISLEYNHYSMTRQLEKLSSRCIDNGIVVTDAVQGCATLMRAYVSRNSSVSGLSDEISIFTTYLSGDIFTPSRIFKWVYSADLECSADFMRNVAIDDRLYSLRYSKKELTNGVRQTFCSSSVMSPYPYLSLKSPPCILDEFDMCGTENEIYVYNKRMPVSPIDTIQSSEEFIGFNKEDLGRGMYVYKRDVDKWFPLPCPKTRFENACMTYDDDMILMYLIGGSNSNKFVQAYDPRTPKWFQLCSTNGTYDGAACCAHNYNVYVVGGRCNPKSFEVYDSISGNWRNLNALSESRSNKHQLVSWLPQYPNTHWRIVSFNQNRSKDSNILFSCERNDYSTWSSMNNLYDAVTTKANNFGHFDINLLDMVNF